MFPLPSGGPSPVTNDPVASIPGPLPLIRFDPMMAPKTLAPTLIHPESFPLFASAPTSVKRVSPAPVVFVPSTNLSLTQFGSGRRSKAPLTLSPTPLTRPSQSSVTTVRSSPVLFSRYTDNSTLLIVCHSLNKFLTIFWGAVHPSCFTLTSFSSYEMFPRRNRVLKTKVNSSGFRGRSTCVEGTRLLAGRECDRLKLDRLVLLFPLHKKTKPFSPRSSLIVAVMLPSSLGVRLCPSLQRITTIFFSVNEKTNRKLVYFTYPRKFLKYKTLWGIANI